MTRHWNGERPDTRRAWLALRVVLAAWLLAAGSPVALVALCLWIAADYLAWALGPRSVSP